MNLEPLHQLIQERFAECFSKEEALHVIKQVTNIADFRFGVKAEDMPNVFETHFGSCVHVDDALESKYPESFADR